MGLNIKEIQEIIPHRHPFLLIDYIEELEVGVRGVGFKSVTYTEPFFAGHFPDRRRFSSPRRLAARPRKPA